MNICPKKIILYFPNYMVDIYKSYEMNLTFTYDNAFIY